ncbi:MFS general substrate transporter [Abortiporus biennis]|nr:MFS general substrate transporter [Abortiporus biennis]
MKADVNIELSPIESSKPTSIRSLVGTGTAVGAKDSEVVAVSTSVDPTLASRESVLSNAPSPSETASQKKRSMIHFGALCFCLFVEGWNDGSTGPLLPTIQSYYGIGFALVSLIFVFNCIGFISGAIMNVYLDEKLGLGKILVLGAALQTISYIMNAPAGPFPIMCTAFCIAGFGISFQNAAANGFVGSLKANASTNLSFLHAAYGLGAFTAPLAATHFATTRHWSFHYLISAGLSLINTILMIAVFRFRYQDEVLAAGGQQAGPNEDVNQNKYRQIISLKTVHFLSLFALIYVGTEVSLGGWIVTFIQERRGGGASAGFISSGFFGGLMLGRILLVFLTRVIGERRSLFLYAFLAIILEITVWVIPSLVENAVAISCVGLLLGPMFPIMMNFCRDIFPRRLLNGSLGWISGFGQAGSAIIPFLAGLFASKFGIGSLQPLVVSMMSTIVIIWALVPRVHRLD